MPTSFQIGAKVSPATAAANYKSGASAKGTKWATNYLMAKVDPFAAAAAAANTWLANLNAAGTAAFSAGLSRVDKGAVATLVSTQGPTLYAQGITNKGAPKYAKAAAGLIPALQQAAANLPARGSLEQNIARSNAMVRAAAAMRGQYRG
ncbi:MAG: hypothetical protein ACREQ5_13550 [Candidatus Dormibacteria bacterium]